MSRRSYTCSAFFRDWRSVLEIGLAAPVVGKEGGGRDFLHNFLEGEEHEERGKMRYHSAFPKCGLQCGTPRGPAGKFMIKEFEGEEN